MIVKSVSHRSRAVDSHRALTVIFEESRCVVYHATRAHVLSEFRIIAYLNIQFVASARHTLVVKDVIA